MEQKRNENARENRPLILCGQNWSKTGVEMHRNRSLILCRDHMQDFAWWQQHTASKSAPLDSRRDAERCVFYTTWPHFGHFSHPKQVDLEGFWLKRVAI